MITDCRKIPYGDKGCHFLVGLVIAVVVSLYLNPLYGLVAGAVVGVLKEAWDEHSYGGGSFFDFFFTLGGTFLGAVLVGVFS